LHYRDKWREGHLRLLLSMTALGVLILAFAVWQACLRLSQSFELDYGEGFVWSQINNLTAGQLYRDLAIYPHGIMHYTPAYHAVVAVVAACGVDPLFAGRLVSLAAAMVLVGTCAVLAWRAMPTDAPTDSKAIAALTAAVVMLGMPVVIEWGTLMRVDMLAVAVSTLGLLAAQRGARDHRWLLLAVACFTLGLCTKQNSVAAPAAACVTLLLARPAAGAALVGGLAAAMAVVVGVGQWTTNGEFLRHVVIYNAAGIRPAIFLALWLPLMAKLLVPLLIAAAVGWRYRPSATPSPSWRDGGSVWMARALSINLALAVLLSLGIVKSGAGTGYILPLLPPMAALAGVGLARSSRLRMALFVGLSAELLIGLWTYPFPSASELAEHDRQDTELLGIVKAADGPVLSEDITLLMRAGRPLPWEFGSTTELSRLGVIDESPFVARLANGWFDTLVVRTWAPHRFTTAVRQAAQNRYRPVRVIGEFEVWRRKDSPAEFPPASCGETPCPG